MKNLAGNEDCDIYILAELDEAGVPCVQLPERLWREVAASVVGELGPFRFERAWYYWVVEGPVPLAVAEKMYADPVGRNDVCIGGHCGCPVPGTYGTCHYDAEGLRLYSDPDGSEQKRWDTIVAEDPECAMSRAFRFVRDAKLEAARSFVEVYHIDSQAGLNLFAATMRKHGLVSGEEAA